MKGPAQLSAVCQVRATGTFVRVLARLPGGRVRVDWCGWPAVLRASELVVCTLRNGTWVPVEGPGGDR